MLSGVAASGVVFGLSVVSLPALPPSVGIVTLGRRPAVGRCSISATRAGRPIRCSTCGLFRNQVFRAAVLGGSAVPHRHRRRALPAAADAADRLRPDAVPVGHDHLRLGHRRHRHEAGDRLAVQESGISLGADHRLAGFGRNDRRQRLLHAADALPADAGDPAGRRLHPLDVLHRRAMRWSMPRSPTPTPARRPRSPPCSSRSASRSASPSAVACWRSARNCMAAPLTARRLSHRVLPGRCDLGDGIVLLHGARSRCRQRGFGPWRAQGPRDRGRAKGLKPTRGLSPPSSPNWRGP